ncbi:MAG: YIP1 family protein [Pseudomonadota bacterium]
MGFTGQILASYRDPGGVMTRMLAAGQREDRALAILMAAALFLFVAQWPAATRAAFFDPSVPLQGRLSGALMGTLFLLPLFAYGLAGAAHLLSRLAGGRGTYYGARIALFWALLCIGPLALFQGLVAGLAGPGAALTATGVLVFLAFLWIWLSGLYVAEFGGVA